MSIEPVEPEEVVDGVAVLDPPRGVDAARSRSALSPMLVQTATAAGVSMLAGATAVALVRHRKASRAARRRSRSIGPVLATRSFLIDVHMLGERK
ncbi:MAG: hypothetical protein QOI73_46 [Solirubrobacteraceae bacterium]|nr:hypothetical protein [Solirubrobacteraceae bacterium]